jgi:hypothetical protein
MLSLAFNVTRFESPENSQALMYFGADVFSARQQLDAKDYFA